MNKKIMSFSIIIICVILLITILLKSFMMKNTTEENINKLESTILNIEKDKVTVQDSNHVLYTFSIKDFNLEVGDNVIIEYMGTLNKNSVIQNNLVINYTESVFNEDEIPLNWQDNGIFKNYYTLAYNKLKTLNLDEKIGQILLVRYPDNAIEELKKYKFGGYLFFEKDFTNKTEDELKNMISSLQASSKIPILTAVDEEGGKVTRISKNSNLVSEPFKSSKELYKEGGLNKIREDTTEKSKILYNLGINLNLAPVVDVTTSPTDYMYERSLGEDATITSNYAKTVIEASKNSGVSYTLKHFPGYGNNGDTHYTTQQDKRSYEDILSNDIPPFEAGIKAGAEAVLISHNIVQSMDADNPASLSLSIHNVLRNEINFTGIIITDDLKMGAVSDIENKTVKAILAGNDLIITTDYEQSINEIKKALENNTLDENIINKLAFRILAWKYYKGMIFDNEK